MIQGDSSLLCGPMNDSLSLLIIGDRIDVSDLIYQVWYLLITPCEIISQASHNVNLFESGLLNFFVLPCRSHFLLFLTGDLSIGKDRGVLYGLVIYFLINHGTVDVLLQRLVTWDYIYFQLIKLSCVEITFSSSFLLWDSLVLNPGPSKRDLFRTWGKGIFGTFFFLDAHRGAMRRLCALVIVVYMY